MKIVKQLQNAWILLKNSLNFAHVLGLSVLGSAVRSSEIDGRAVAIVISLYVRPNIKIPFIVKPEFV